jgi:hypothetical protein
MLYIDARYLQKTVSGLLRISDPAFNLPPSQIAHNAYKA